MKLVRIRRLVSRRRVVVSVFLLLLLPGVLSAGGLNPLDPGLPSALYGTDNIPKNGASAMCVSCHTVVPVSGKGSHFVHQTGRVTIDNNQATKERTLAWNRTTPTVPVTPDPLSKYGNYSTTPITSVTDPSNVMVGKRELICESCHNLLLNVGGGNNLVATSFNADARPVRTSILNDPSNPSTTLCEGCHVSASLPGHHPMTGDTLSDGVSTLSNAGSPFTRAFVDNLTQVPAANTSEVIYPGLNKMGCLTCHGNGHSGLASTGARILRRGFAGGASPSTLSPTSSVVGTATGGAQRQFDKDSFGLNRLIPNWQPLCDSCHTVND